MFSFPPAYYHNIIAASSPTPIFYLDLSAFGKEVQQTMTLCKDKVELCSPQARYRVQRWVYRAVISIKPGMVTGPRRMGVAETVARDWVGSVVIEVEGTSEHARELLKRCSKEWSIEMERVSIIFCPSQKQIYLVCLEGFRITDFLCWVDDMVGSLYRSSRSTAQVASILVKFILRLGEL